MSTLDELSNENTFDAHDLQDRIDELESLDLADMSDDERANEYENEVAELETLLELADEIGDSTLRYGETMIRESYMTDYLRELVYDIGDLPRDLPSYIESNIDWDGVCDDLMMDYSECEIDGVTFYFRSC